MTTILIRILIFISSISYPPPPFLFLGGWIFCCDPGYPANLIELILTKGGNPNLAMKQTGSTPLLICMQQGAVDIAKLLLKHGADPNVATLTAQKLFPLLIAVQKGHVAVVKLLLHKRADPNQVGGRRGGVTSQHVTPLCIAAGNAVDGSVECLKLLLASKGVEVDKACGSGLTPLFIALYVCILAWKGVGNRNWLC